MAAGRASILERFVETDEKSTGERGPIKRLPLFVNVLRMRRSIGRKGIASMRDESLRSETLEDHKLSGSLRA
jgi:hypothetical protein